MNRTFVSTDERLSTLSSDQTELLKLLIEKQSRRTHRIKCSERVSRNGAVRLPTSWAQERLWFIDQLEGAGSAYYVSLGTRLRGRLDLHALQRALDLLVQRHEVLRTVFVSEDGQPSQQIAPDGRFDLAVVDLRECAHAEREAQVRLQEIEEAHRKFDLRTGPLVRGRLLRLQEDENVLLITMHHIISDGWSIRVLFDEIEELYAATLQRRPSRLEPLPIQYADYAQWQRQWLHKTEMEKQVAYWKTRLQGAPPQIELPTDRPRPQAQSYRGANAGFTLDAKLTTRLKALAQEQDMTLFMVLYSAWAIVLSRLSGQEDIVIGTPVANRQRPELEKLIGFFVNTLVLRVNVPSEQRLDQFFESVKQVTLGAYDHQDVPFEHLVETLEPERSLSRHPIFQAMLVLQNAPKSDLHLSGLTSTPEAWVDDPAMFDVLLGLEEREGEILGNLNYAADLFDRETIDRWVSCLVTLLRGMTESLQSRICDLPFLPESEHQLLSSFNQTGASSALDRCVHELFEEQVRRTPDAVAVEYEGEWLSYGQLNAKANQLARYLVNSGVGAGSLVGICLERSVELVVGVLAVLKAGGAYVPLDPNYPAERLQYMLEDAQPQVLLTHEELRAMLPASEAKVIELHRTLQEISGYLQEDLGRAELGVSAEDLVYVIYTSGSTGRPKGTAMRHFSMVNLLQWQQEQLGGECRRVLQFAALSFDVAFQEIFSTLSSGGTLVLLGEWLRRDAQGLLEFLQRRGIERLFVPPLMLQSLAECHGSGGERRTLALRDVITAGEQLRVTAEVVEFFGSLSGCRLHNHYGPTETHVVSSLTLGGDAGSWPELPAIGRPIWNTQIYVLDGQRQRVPIGVAGEIYIGGRAVARGYLGQPQLSAERFVADPFSAEPGARMYRTGDVGRWRLPGVLEYLGRNDDQVKIRGYRIELGEVEAQLLRHESVREAAVVARQDSGAERRLVAYVTQRESGATVEELRGHLQGLLPQYMVPSAIVTLQQMPLTPSGKLDRRALPAPELSAYVSRQYEPPQGELEHTLASIWQDLLHIGQVGRHDNFFELGGHSLHGIKLVARIADQLMVRLSAIAVFQHPTIHQMAKAIECLQLVQEPAYVEGDVDIEEGAI